LPKPRGRPGSTPDAIRTAIRRGASNTQALTTSGIELVGEAATGQAAIDVVVDVRPDVVLMDLRLPGVSGIQAIEQLGLLAPASRVLVLTRSEHNRVVEAIVAGATGYILKSAPPEAIISAVRVGPLLSDRRQAPAPHS
jgi:DNA-binding NarL/FixJ family response regulator